MEQLLIAVVLLVLILTPVFAIIGVVTAVRWLRRAGAQPNPPPHAACPRCGFDAVTAGRCQRCGWITRPVQSVQPDELAITAKQLGRLLQAGLIDQVTFDKVMNALDAVAPSPPAATSAPTPIGPAPQPIHDITPPPLPIQLEPVRVIPAATPLPIPLAPPVAPPPQRVLPVKEEPRKSLAELLGHFMEESNIRWGELVGGLLIVGCSIALVLTFWGWIESRPWVKFFLFTAVTAAVFLTGIYTERRWKLPHTSRGLLLIATLLVPLNFLAIAAFSRGMAAMSVPRVGGELVALGLFAWLVYIAGRILVPDWAGLLSMAVLGASASQGIVHRLALPSSQASVGMTLLLAAIPLAFYCGTIAAVLLRSWRRAELSPEHASELVRFLGATSFATILPLGLLAYLTRDASWLMPRIAPLICFGGLPALACGLLIWQRLTDAKFATLRTAGTMIAVIGAMILLAGLPMAGPNPAALLPVALIDFAALTAVAIFFQIPMAHVPALGCAVLAYLLGAHLVLPSPQIGWHEQWPPLLRALLSPRTAAAMVVCFGVLSVAAEAWRRAQRHADASCYALMAMLVAVLSIAFASWHGLWRQADHGATWIFAIYALAGCAIAWHLRKPQASWVGLGLLAVALVQGLAFRFHLGPRLVDGIVTGLLAHASIMAIAAAAVRWFNGDQRWSRVLSWSGTFTSGVASAIVLAAMPNLQTGAVHVLASQVFWVAAIWFVIALVDAAPAMFGAFQVALTGAVGLGVLAVLRRHDWYLQSHAVLLEPWTLQAIGIAWAGLSVIWTLIRRLVGQDRSQLLIAPWGSIDRWTTGLVLAGLVVLSAWAVWPGIEAELALRENARAAVMHPARWGGGAWMLLGTMLLALGASLWERFSRWAMLGLVLAMACAGPLVAARWEGQTASASALRWTMAAFLLAMSVPAWVWASAIWRDVRTLVLSLTIPFILMLTLFPAGVLLGGEKIVGPGSESFFATIGQAWSFLPPLIAVIGAMVGYALRERSAGFAFAGGLVLNLTVTLGYLLALVTPGVRIDAVNLVTLVQFNAIASAAYALAWLAVGRWAQAEITPLLLSIQTKIAPALLVCLLVPAELALLANTAGTRSAIAAVGGGWGWLAWAMTGAAVVWMAFQARRVSADAVGIAMLVLGSMGAFAVCAATQDTWIGQHTLLAARVAAAWLMLGFGWIVGIIKSEQASDAPEDRIADAVTRWAVIFGAMALILALRLIYDDPTRPTWAVGGLIAVSLLSVGLAFWTSRGAWFYPAGVLLNAAATVWWVIQGGAGSPSPGLELLLVNCIVLGLGGLGLLVLDLGVLRPMTGQVVGRGLAYHRFAAGIVVVLAMLSAAGVLVRMGGRWELVLAGMAAAWALAIGCLWDRDARLALRGMYWLGLAGIVAGMGMLRISDDQVLAYGAVALAGYAVVMGYLYTMRVNLARAAEGMGVPMRENWPAEHAGWVGTTAVVQAVVVGLLAWFVVLDQSRLGLRLAAGTGLIAAAVGAGLLEKRRAALLLGVVGMILWGWAWQQPHGTGEVLNRAVVVMAATAGMAIFYAIGMVKILRRENEWTRAARELVPIIGAGMVAALLFVLGVEWATADATGTAMAWWGFVAVLGVLIALGAAAIVCAVVPGRDPLELSERQRMGYVYGAEVVLVLVFLHLRLNFPEIFARGIWVKYWPFIIMAVAFTGVGLSEVFRRQGRMVLAEPLERTGAFLPVLPVLAYWAMRGAVGFHNPIGRVGREFTYAEVLFLAGVVYGVLSLLRKSYGFGLVAGLMANGGLWAVWGQVEGLGFLRHPQLWLVPVAGSMLVAGQMNREKLGEERLKAVRYVGLMVIYVSSTVDLWLNGVRDNPWLALVLMVLAVGGVMLGILLRIQSFLFLGTLFLVVAILSMIQYAAARADSNWPWMVAGIVLGIGIVGMFGVFEKKRAEMLGMVEGLRQWEA